VVFLAFFWAAALLELNGQNSDIPRKDAKSAKVLSFRTKREILLRSLTFDSG